MAANIIEPGSSLALLASTIDLSQVPDKLHCSTCHRFLINAYRTTCCESYLCDACFDQLDDSCPICKHEPFSKEIVRPNKAMRGTAKAYLKSVEKAQAEERTKPQIDGDTALPTSQSDRATDFENGHDGLATNGVHQDRTDVVGETRPVIESTPDIQTSIEMEAPTHEPPVQAISPSPEQGDQNPRAPSHSSDEMEDDDDDEIEIQVEPAEGEEYHMHPIRAEAYEEDTSFVNSIDNTSEHPNDHKDGTNELDMNFNTSSMGMNFNMNMQPMQMMQQMQQMMMGNPMMGAMGMNSNMFGGFPNGGMNGMDMNMMNFANQNMFGWNGQNNNNFNNPYSNGMNGSFGPSFGFDMSQQGSFQQQFQNGDFQNGYSDYRGRGRGRFRGGRGSFRGRGHFDQFSQNNFKNTQNVSEHQQQQQQQQQQQYEDSMSQDQGQNRSHGTRAVVDRTNIQFPEHEQVTGDLVPGGQTEVQEALGDQFGGPRGNSEVDITPETPNENLDHARGTFRSTAESTNSADVVGNESLSAVSEKPIPEAYHEDFDNMAPPSAPSGPAARYNDRDYGFRSRGRGKYGNPVRNTLAQRDLHPISPVKTTSPTSTTTISSPQTQGLGVQGAPTGPRAMRDPVIPKSSPVTNGGGFQIKGQAAIQSQSQLPLEDQTQSPAISNGYESSEDRGSRKVSRPEHFGNFRSEDNRATDSERRDYERSRKRSRRDEDEDDEMDDVDAASTRRAHSDRRSHRSERNKRDRDRERDRYSSKHKSSRDHYDDDGGDSFDLGENGMDIDSHPAGHRTTNRNAKTSKHGELDRERERDRLRANYRDGDGDRDRNRDRHRDRDRDRDDRHRKRSRHDRDREDEDEDDGDHESRHRARRHKKEHHSSSRRDRDRDRDRLEPDDIGLRISGRASSNYNQPASALPTPTSTKSEGFEAEKDPHTLEREARNRERLLKEQQRREKAAAEKKGGSNSKYGRSSVSGGRKVSYKYEDEIERSMDESDRRWR